MDERNIFRNELQDFELTIRGRENIEEALKSSSALSALGSIKEYLRGIEKWRDWENKNDGYDLIVEIREGVNEIINDLKVGYMIKYYEAKKEHLSHVLRYLQSTEKNTTGYTFDSETEVYKMLREAGVLDLWCEEISQWDDPLWDAKLVTLTDKPLLLIRMQSWADFYNKIDNFAPNWESEDCKFGIIIENIAFRVSMSQLDNPFLFQISVNSSHRAKEMLEFFKREIRSLINQNLI